MTGGTEWQEPKPEGTFEPDADLQGHYLRREGTGASVILVTGGMGLLGLLTPGVSGPRAYCNRTAT